jgi:AcrR family transcriptional regulator
VTERMTKNRTRTAEAGGRTLTEARIVDAAIAIADGENLTALTIRRLAADLGVGAMTLYSYFRGKDEILDAIADKVLGEMVLPEPPEDGPRGALRSVADGFLVMMRAHPSVIRLLTLRTTDSHKALRGGMELILARLVESGLSGPTAVHAYGVLMYYTLGFASYQRPRPWGLTEQPGSAELRRQRRHAYAALPAEEFPHMVEFAEQLTALPATEEFYRGLDYLIDSLVRDYPR